MGLWNTRDGWGLPARILHWGMAVLVLFMSALGLWMTNAYPRGDFAAFGLYQLHKSWGAVVLLLALLRITWRLLDPVTPALPAKTPPLQRVVVRATHWGIYALLLALPVSGWLMVSASPVQDYGVPNMVFGLVHMPDPFVPGDIDLSERFRRLHGALWLALSVLVTLHVLGALWHHLVARDTVLRRMVLGR